MAKKTNYSWLSGIVVNLISSMIAFLVGGVVTYFERAGSIWIKPLTFGLLTWLLVTALIYLFRLGLRLPLRTDEITDDNLESHIRDWMDRYNLKVQRFNDPELYFSFVITTIGDKKIAVKRRMAFSEYINFSADFAALSDEEKRIFDALSDEEKLRAITEVRLELSRAVVGVVVPKSIPEGFTLFRQLPISRSLTEAEFIREVWGLEAVVNTVMEVNGLTRLRLQREGLVSPKP